MAENTGSRATQLKSADRQGNAGVVQMFGGGATTTGNPGVYDANGNIISGSWPGGSGTSADEVPSGTQNGANVTFTISHTPLAGTLLVLRNGLPQDANWISVSGTTITFVAPPRAADQLRAKYSY